HRICTEPAVDEVDANRSLDDKLTASLRMLYHENKLASLVANVVSKDPAVVAGIYAFAEFSEERIERTLAAVTLQIEQQADGADDEAEESDNLRIEGVAGSA